MHEPEMILTGRVSSLDQVARQAMKRLELGNQAVDVPEPAMAYEGALAKPSVEKPLLVRVAHLERENLQLHELIAKMASDCEQRLHRLEGTMGL